MPPRAHELRTPIAAILGNAELLEDGVPELPTFNQLPLVQAIQSGAKRLDKLVNDLLLIGGISAGTLEVRPQVLELDGLLAHLVQAQTHQAHTHGLPLVYTPAAAPIFVLADQERLIQALMHLVDNAIKFTPAGGRIEVVAGEGSTFWVTLPLAKTGAVTWLPDNAVRPASRDF